MPEQKEEKKYPMLSVRMTHRMIDDIREGSVKMGMKVPQFIRYVLMQWISSSIK